MVNTDCRHPEARNDGSRVCLPVPGYYPRFHDRMRHQSHGAAEAREVTCTGSVIRLAAPLPSAAGV